MKQKDWEDLEIVKYTLHKTQREDHYSGESCCLLRHQQPWEGIHEEDAQRHASLQPSWYSRVPRQRVTLKSPNTAASFLRIFLSLPRALF